MGPAPPTEAFDVVLPDHGAASDPLEAAAALDVPPPATVASADVVLPGPAAGGPPPKATEMVFTEPVRTIRLGGAVVELRRLTPEERRSRRIRRNVMMIVVCVSILVVIVIVAGFGTPSGRR